MVGRFDRHRSSDGCHLRPILSLAALVLSLTTTSLSAIEAVGPPPYICTVDAVCTKEKECQPLDLHLEVFVWPDNTKTSGFDFRREKPGTPSGYRLEGLRGRQIEADYYEDTESARLALREFQLSKVPDIIMVENKGLFGEFRDFRVYSLRKDSAPEQRTFGPGYTQLSCSNIYR